MQIAIVSPDGEGPLDMVTNGNGPKFVDQNF